MIKPDFLNQPGAQSTSSSGPPVDRPQKSGTPGPDGGSDRFPNRPQKDGSIQGNPQSIPDGGKLPFTPVKETPKPWKGF